MINRLASVFFLSCLVTSALGKMKPVVIDGRYYSDKDSRHEFMSFSKAMTFLQKRVFSPTRMIGKMTSLFYAEQKAVLDVHSVLNPTQSIPQPYCQEPVITWVGHATFLIQTNGFNILTDPAFGDIKVGPLTISKRNMKPGIALEALPVIHAIILSHNHHDHTDTRSLMYLAQEYDPVVYVPLGNKELIESMGFSHVIERNWWDCSTLTVDNQDLQITCLPAYHWSMRSFWGLEGYRKSLWSSWMVSTHGHAIYFAGDTAYGKHFKEIAAHFPVIDVALMPIGPTDAGKNTHKEAHIDALEAVDAFIDLQALQFIPMHYGTFFLSENTLIYPLKRLQEYWQSNADKLHDTSLLIAQCGKPYTV